MDLEDLENLSRQSVPKDEIALRIEATRREREEAARRQIEIRSRRRVVVVLILAVSATVGATATYYWSRWFPPGPQPTQVHSKPAEKPSQVSVTGRSIQDACQVVAADAYVAGFGSFSIKVFDFFANRFLRGKEVLSNSGGLQDAFHQEFFQSALKDSWVVIFAGASFEDQEDYNLELCGRRVRYVVQLLRETEGISPRGLWGIRAGEYRETPPGRTTALSEEEEEVQAKLMGPKKLATQRRLLIISITPVGKQFPAANDQAIVAATAQLLLENGIIPKNYDYASTAPTFIDVQKGRADSNGKVAR